MNWFNILKVFYNSYQINILSQIQIKGRWLNEQIYGGIKQNEWSVEPIAQSHSRVVE